jgi:hypothetical protein
MRNQAEALPQEAGHAIHAVHIEPPTTAFLVTWRASDYQNVVLFADTQRWCRVLAQTPEGALRIARYHYGLKGYDHRLLKRAAAPDNGEDGVFPF